MIRLKEIRLANHLEVRDMCRKLDVTDSRYRKWESGTNGMPLDYALMCCDIFHCSLDELSGRRDQPLSADERYIISVYRNSSPREREYIMRMVQVADEIEKRGESS